MRHFVLFLAALCLLAAPRALAEDGNPVTPNADPRVLIETSMGDITIELWPKVAPKTVEIFLGLAEGKGTFTDVADPEKKVTLETPFFDGLGFHRVIKDFMLQGGCPMGNGMGDAGFKFADEINGKKLGLDKQKVLQNGKPHQWLGVRSMPDWQKNVLIPVLRHLNVPLDDVTQQQARQAEIKKTLDEMTLYDLYTILGYKYDETLPSVPPTRGVIALANAGPNTNSSQFFLNLIDTPWLTGKHTVFGKVVGGMDVVDKIGTVKVDAGSKPVEPVTIKSIRRIK